MSKTEETGTKNVKVLTSEEEQRLDRQNDRMVSEFKANMLENEALKHWDLFYKRNETRFFKDRHWTTREFSELLDGNISGGQKVLFEVGCGVGNFIFPLVEENLPLKIFACDFSARAIQMVKNHPKYESNQIQAFQCDITSETVFEYVNIESVDIITLIFVLSAIHPERFILTLKTIYKLLKPGGLLLFRDYGLYDMAQLRFKPGSKISDNFYMRQDGTRSYYFSMEYAGDIFKQAGFTILENCYINRRTVNKKENIDVPRIFIQIKARRPIFKEVNQPT